MTVRPNWSCSSYICEVSADLASFLLARPDVEHEVKISEDKWKLKLKQGGGVGRVLVRRSLEILIRSCSSFLGGGGINNSWSRSLDPGRCMSKGRGL